MKEFILLISSFIFAVSFTGILIYNINQYVLLKIYLFINLIILAILARLYVVGEVQRINWIIYCEEYSNALVWMWVIYQQKRKDSHWLTEIRRIEIILFLCSIIVGVSCVLYLHHSNAYYILPYNRVGPIANFYFNADTYRSTYIVTSNYPQHLMHPCYRMILNAFILPCKLFCGIFGGSYYIYAYYLTGLQIIWNAISVVLIYELVSDGERARKTKGIVTAVLYMITGANIWSLILPETYSLTLCVLLVSVYLCNVKSSFAYAFMLLAIGMNPMTSVVYLPFIYKDILQKIKQSGFFIKTIIVLLPLCLAVVTPAYINNILTYRNTSLNIWTNVKKLICNFLAAGFWGPTFEYREPFFVQTVEWNLVLFFSLIVLAAFLAMGVTRRKNAIDISCVILVFFAAILHGLIGFGINNGIIYSPLYTWAVVILIVENAAELKRYFAVRLLFCSFLTVTFLLTTKWIYTFGEKLGSIPFPIDDWKWPSVDFVLNEHRLRFDDAVLVDMNNQEVVLRDIDSIMISEKKGCISGLLESGNYYSIEIENDKLKVCIDE